MKYRVRYRQGHNLRSRDPTQESFSEEQNSFIFLLLRTVITHMSTSTMTTMNYSPPSFQHFSGECRYDSFLQLSSPIKKDSFAKIDRKGCLKGCLKKPLKTRAVNKLASIFEKDKFCKQKRAVKFASAAEYFSPGSNKEIEYAAIDIQRIARGRWQRLLFRIALPQHYAAISIQRIARGRWQRLSFRIALPRHSAAISIQRIARGRRHRLLFRIAFLQHKLDTYAERTAASIQRIRDRTQKRKDKLTRQVEKQKQAVLKRSAQESTIAQESRKICFFLRKENNKLRLKNEKIYMAIQALTDDNARLENANIATDEHFSTLGDQAKHIEEMNTLLLAVVPEYEKGVKDMSEAVDTRQQFCLTEHTIRLTYVQAIVTAAEMMEDRCTDTDLVDEIFEYCLSNEEHEEMATAPSPPKLVQLFEEQRDGSDSSDGAEYDEYTVVTME
jgi:hypothetical protein